MKKKIVFFIYFNGKRKIGLQQQNLQILESSFRFELVKLSPSKFYVTKKTFTFRTKIAFFGIFRL